MLVTSEDVGAVAAKACLGIPHCERLVPPLLQAPLSSTQQHRLVALWLAPMANEYNQARRAKTYSHIAVLLIYSCHIGIAACHILGTVLPASANTFAVLGVILTGMVASGTALRERIPDANVHASAASRIEAVGTRFVMGQSQEHVDDADFKACVNDLIAAAHPELPAQFEVGAAKSQEPTIKQPTSSQQAALHA
jgi:hypothetical protein